MTMALKWCDRYKQIVVGDKSKVTGISVKILDKLRGEILPPYFGLGSNRDKFCDFTVVVGDTEFACHRFVLSACSGFFEALLRSDMKESREMKADVHGILPEIFKLILDVIYGNCEVLMPDKMIDIWKAAHQLQIQSLITACESHFINNVNADNCFITYTHAQLLQSTQVKSVVLNYIIQNFYALVVSENLVKLDLEDFLQIIQNKSLLICDDLKIVAILKWCDFENKHNKSTSSESSQVCSKLQFIGRLIQAVDLTKVTAMTLADLLTNPFIHEDKTASAAINMHAATKLAMCHADHGSGTGTRNCLHCKGRYLPYDPDSSDLSSDSDD